MFHKHCKSEIEFLRGELMKERERNRILQEQILVMADKPVIPVGPSPANVYYMDDARLLEMQEEGNVPT